MKKYYLDTKILDNMWNEWLEDKLLTAMEEKYVKGKPYSGMASMAKNKRERFSNWLFKQGLTIRRRDKRAYIECSDETMAAYLTLRYS